MNLNVNRLVIVAKCNVNLRVGSIFGDTNYYSEEFVSFCPSCMEQQLKIEKIRWMMYTKVSTG